MNKFLKLLSILLGLTIIVLVYPNVQAEVQFLLYDGNAVRINLFLLSVLIFIGGSLSGLFYAIAFYLPVQKKLKEYQRKLEKTGISADEESSKVAVLEAKIATLEKALESALKNE